MPHRKRHVELDAILSCRRLFLLMKVALPVKAKLEHEWLWLSVKGTNHSRWKIQSSSVTDVYIVTDFAQIISHFRKYSLSSFVSLSVRPCLRLSLCLSGSGFAAAENKKRRIKVAGKGKIADKRKEARKLSISARGCDKSHGLGNLGRKSPVL